MAQALDGQFFRLPRLRVSSTLRGPLTSQLPLRMQQESEAMNGEPYRALMKPLAEFAQTWPSLTDLTGLAVLVILML